MCSRLKTFFAGLAAVTVTPALFAVPPPEYECVKASQPPSLSGSLLDWSDATPILCCNDAQRKMPLYCPTADLDVTAYLLWDDNFLYFAVNVDDDRFCQNSAGASVWQDDSVQCAFDLDNSTPRKPRLDCEYEIALTKSGPSAHAGIGPPGPVAGAKLAITQKTANQGLFYELAIPWNTLNGMKPAPGKRFGFTFLVNDNDGAGRKGWIEWTPGIAAGKTPDTFATITLADGKSGTSLPRGQINLTNRFYEQGTPVEFTAIVQSATAIPAATLAYTLFDANGKKLKELQSTIAIPKGVTRLAEKVDGSGLPIGKQTLRLNLDGRELASSAFCLVSVAGMTAKVTAMEQACATLEALITQGQSKGFDMSYARLHLATGRAFCRYSQENLGRKLYAEFARDTDYLIPVLATAIKDATHFLATPDRSLCVPVQDLNRLSLVDGAFRVDGQPVLLIGPVGWYQDADFPLIREAGYNLVSDEIGPLFVLPAENLTDRGAVAALKSRIDLSRQNNLAFNLLLSIHYVPEWAKRKFPDLSTRGTAMNSPPESNNFMPGRLDSPAYRTLIGDFLNQVIPAVKTAPNLIAYCLANESVYYDYNDYDVPAFKAYLQQTYGNIQALNQAWGTAYVDFAALEAPKPYLMVTPPETEVPQSRWRDWLLFNQARCTGFFAWMRNDLNRLDPRTPAHLKVPGLGGGRNGVEGEAIADLCEISGLDNMLEFSSPLYAIDFGELAAYDFYRSINPGHPVFDSEMHVTGKADAPDGYFQLRLWLSYLHGVKAASIWVWDRKLKADRSILSEPQRMIVMGRTALDIRRLAPQIDAFQREAAPMVILRAQSSLLARRGDHAKGAAEAYAALYMLPFPCGFTTEKRLASPVPATCRLIVAPDVQFIVAAAYAGLERFVKAGGTLVLTGENPLGKDPDGRARDVSPLLHAAGVIRTTPQALRTVVKAALAKQGVTPRLVPVLATAAGPEPGPDGIECRVAGRWAYLANLRQEPAVLAIHQDGKALPKCRDLISGRMLETPLTLNSLDIVMFELQETP